MNSSDARTKTELRFGAAARAVLLACPSVEKFHHYFRNLIDIIDITMISCLMNPLQEVRKPTMKESSRLALVSAIAVILLLSLVNAGTCRQVTPISGLTPPTAHAAQYPSSYASPATSVSPLYAPQQFLANGGLPNGQGYCLNNGCCQCRPAISIAAQIGYGYIGLDLNMQAAQAINDFTRADLNLAFKNVVVPIGSLQVRAQASSGLFVALRLQGNAPRDIAINTPDAPLGGGPDFNLATLTLSWVNPRKWDGANLQWWMLEGDIGCRVSPHLSALAGLRRDKLSVGLTNPRDAAGQPLNLDIAVPAAGFFLTRTMQADFSSEAWIPCLGVEIAGPRYRASLLWGPYAWTAMRLPYRYRLDPYGGLRIEFDYECKEVETANLLECNAEYDFNVSSRVACRLWTTGNWMQLSWKGELKGATAFEGVPDVIEVPATPFSPPMEIHPVKSVPVYTEVDRADHTRWMISGGIGAVLAF
jgi:hypothetical protein